MAGVGHAGRRRGSDVGGKRRRNRIRRRRSASYRSSACRIIRLIVLIRPCPCRVRARARYSRNCRVPPRRRADDGAPPPPRRRRRRRVPDRFEHPVHVDPVRLGAPAGSGTMNAAAPHRATLTVLVGLAAAAVVAALLTLLADARTRHAAPAGDAHDRHRARLRGRRPSGVRRVGGRAAEPCGTHPRTTRGARGDRAVALQDLDASPSQRGDECTGVRGSDVDVRPEARASSWSGACATTLPRLMTTTSSTICATSASAWRTARSCARPRRRSAGSHAATGCLPDRVRSTARRGRAATDRR